jgi:hypothetical protein
MTHPWGKFLEVRKEVIKWMTDEMGRDNAEIAHALSMDEQQVYLIKKHMEEEDVRRLRQT